MARLSKQKDHHFVAHHRSSSPVGGGTWKLKTTSTPFPVVRFGTCRPVYLGTTLTRADGNPSRTTGIYPRPQTVRIHGSEGLQRIRVRVWVMHIPDTTCVGLPGRTAAPDRPPNAPPRLAVLKAVVSGYWDGFLLPWDSTMPRPKQIGTQPSEPEQACGYVWLFSGAA